MRGPGGYNEQSHCQDLLGPNAWNYDGFDFRGDTTFPYPPDELWTFDVSEDETTVTWTLQMDGGVPDWMGLRAALIVTNTNMNAFQIVEFESTSYAGTLPYVLLDFQNMFGTRAVLIFCWSDFREPFDTDGDGCIDGEEIGTDIELGGMRDPLNPWDFADVPAPALPGGARNGAVALTDVGAALTWVGAVNGGMPNVNGRDYDDDSNTNGVDDGAEYDRTPNGEISGPPNGAISLQDVGVILAQVGDSCLAAPN
jgi:hypothetical protein